VRKLLGWATVRTSLDARLQLQQVRL